MSPDYYHTNYALAGWSIGSCRGKEHHTASNPDLQLSSAEDAVVVTRDPKDSKLRFVNPIFSLPRDRISKVLQHVYKNSVLPDEVKVPSS